MIEQRDFETSWCWAAVALAVALMAACGGDEVEGTSDTGSDAIGVGDRVFMLKYATYAVISPEGCASILWKSAEKAADAAAAMGMTSERLLKLGLIDAIIEEPLGGAHRDIDQTVRSVGDSLMNSLDELSALDPDSLLQRRRAKFRGFGNYNEK